MQKERWTAVVDAVGSHTLVNACAQVRYGGAVAACGLAQGFDLPATVMPFILGGVALLGVDSVMAPIAKRRKAWARLAVDLDPTSRFFGCDKNPAGLPPPLAADHFAEIPLND